MNNEKKIERQYKKYEQLLDNASNEHEQGKADKALDKLAKLFPNDQEFKTYLQSKISTTLRIN